MKLVPVLVNDVGGGGGVMVPQSMVIPRPCFNHV